VATEIALYVFIYESTQNVFDTLLLLSIIGGVVALIAGWLLSHLVTKVELASSK
jgi:hypothetical protein